MWFIYSLKKEYLSSDNGWNAKGVDIKPFATKAEALDFVRADIEADQTADPPRYPRMTGCRVVELRAHVLELLKKRGEHVLDRDGDVWIVFNAAELKPSEAKTRYPADLLGVPIRLRTTLDQVIR